MPTSRARFSDRAVAQVHEVDAGNEQGYQGYRRENVEIRGARSRLGLRFDVGPQVQVGKGREGKGLLAPEHRVAELFQETPERAVHAGRRFAGVQQHVGVGMRNDPVAAAGFRPPAAGLTANMVS
jgi:hypothetical protein